MKALARLLILLLLRTARPGAHFTTDLNEPRKARGPMTRSELPADSGYVVLPRKLSWAAAIAIVGYAGTAAVFALSLHNRASQLEAADARTLIYLAERKSSNENRFAAIGTDRDRLIRVEVQVQQQTELLREIKGLIDRQRFGSTAPPSAIGIPGEFLHGGR